MPDHYSGGCFCTVTLHTKTTALVKGMVTNAIENLKKEMRIRSFSAPVMALTTWTINYICSSLLISIHYIILMTSLLLLQ